MGNSDSMTGNTADNTAANTTGYAIGALERAGRVGVETVRDYQRRGLLPQPPKPARLAGAYRRYRVAAVARLRFIRRAQRLGFALDEIAELLQLADGTDRRWIRRIASARLARLEARIADMQRMADTLHHLIHACEDNGRAPHCPIVESITEPGDGR
jgi:MerR family mercuric resistance operon transcriptional regulator